MRSFKKVHASSSVFLERPGFATSQTSRVFGAVFAKNT